MPELFTASDAQNLADFLAERHRPQGTLSYPQLAGFLFAVCCSPELVQADDWMSVIFDNQDPGYFNEKEDKNRHAVKSSEIDTRLRHSAPAPPVGPAQHSSVL